MSLPRAHASVRAGAAVVLVAAGACLFAIGFRSGLAFIYGHILGGRDVVAAFRRLPVAARVLVPALGGVLVGLLGLATKTLQSQGVGNVMDAAVRGERHLSLRSTFAKAAGSFLAIATGGSIGREGPLIQFGGSLGHAVGVIAKVTESQRRALIAAGTAAGFAAAYNTPLAAVLFVFEIFVGIVMAEAAVPVLCATALATVGTRWAVGGGPIYGERVFSLVAPAELGAHALLGVVVAFGAQFFMRLLNLGERLFDGLALRQPLRAALGGLVVGAIAVFIPEVTGNGYEPLNTILDGQLAIRFVGVLVIAKMVATTSSVSSGSPGGVFTPSLLIGGALGALWGHGVGLVTGSPGGEGSYALVGMAASVAATTHAPLMSAVLVFELSGDYAIVLPLVLATALSTWTSRRLRADSIYMAELRRVAVPAPSSSSP